MTTTYYKSGHTLQYTPSGSPVTSSQVVGPLGTASRFGVAITAIAVAATGALATSGEHTLAAEPDDVWADGDILYWDAADSNLTDVADSGTNKQIGIAVGAKASTVATAVVLLNSVPA